jgi:hypothetical protein
MIVCMEKTDSTPSPPCIDSFHLKFSGSGPSRYRIIVGKKLSANWSDRLAGMEIRPVQQESSTGEATLLEGVVKDQAQLSGILNTLYDYGFPLLKVEILGESAPTDCPN